MLLIKGCERMPKSPAPRLYAGGDDDEHDATLSNPSIESPAPSQEEIEALEAWAEEILRESASEVWLRDPSVMQVLLNRLPSYSVTEQFYDRLRARREGARSAMRTLKGDTSPSPGRLLSVLCESAEVSLGQLARALEQTEERTHAIVSGKESLFSAVAPERLTAAASLLQRRVAFLVAALEAATQLYFERQVAIRAGGTLARSDVGGTANVLADRQQLAQAALRKERERAAKFFAKARTLRDGVHSNVERQSP